MTGCATDTALRHDPPRSPGAALVQRMTFPPLQLTVPRVGREVERRVLSNGMVLYLASDRSSYVNGDEITVDGGYANMLMNLVPRPGFE